MFDRNCDKMDTQSAFLWSKTTLGEAITRMRGIGKLILAGNRNHPGIFVCLFGVVTVVIKQYLLDD